MLSLSNHVPTARANFAGSPRGISTAAIAGEL